MIEPRPLVLVATCWHSYSADTLSYLRGNRTSASPSPTPLPRPPLLDTVLITSIDLGRSQRSTKVRRPPLQHVQDPGPKLTLQPPPHPLNTPSSAASPPLLLLRLLHLDIRTRPLPPLAVRYTVQHGLAHRHSFSTSCSHGSPAVFPTAHARRSSHAWRARQIERGAEHAPRQLGRTCFCPSTPSVSRGLLARRSSVRGRSGRARPRLTLGVSLVAPALRSVTVFCYSRARFECFEMSQLVPSPLSGTRPGPVGRPPGHPGPLGTSPRSRAGSAQRCSD